MGGVIMVALSIAVVIVGLVNDCWLQERRIDKNIDEVNERRKQP